MDTKALQRRIDRMIADIDKRLLPVTIRFTVHWGDEPLPDTGNPVFQTQWNTGLLEDESEDSIEV